MKYPLHIAIRQVLRASVCLLFSIAFLKGYSQNPIDKWINKGEAARLDQSFPDAIEYFEWAMRMESDPRPSIGLGKCYWALRDYKKAAEFFGQAVNYPNIQSDIYFLLAQSLLSVGDRTGAEKWFRIYDESTPEADQVIKWEDLQYLFNKRPLDSTQLEISPLPFNTSASEFGAVPLGDALYFCSSRKTNSSIVHVSTLNDAPLVDLFFVQDFFAEDAGRKSAKPVQELNSRFNEGPMCFSKDGETMFFTRNNSELKKSVKGKVQLNKLQIYKSVWQEGHWSSGESLPFNNDDYAVGHPALSPDEQRLYFSSDIPGGYGGTDIYFVTILPSGGYGEPVNLGSKINSPGDEMFPFISSEGALFFASDYHLGFGGLDIFKSVPFGSEWAIPYNLGPPINSSEDDFAYFLYSDGKSGLLSSNRGNSYENDDLYEFKIARPTFDCSPQEQNSYCYRFTEEGSFDIESDTSAQFIYEWDFGDGTRSVGLKVEHCFPGPGDYLVQLNLIDTVSDFVFMNEATEMIEVRDIEQIFIESPDTVLVGEAFELDASKSVFEGMLVREYYWDIGGLEYQRGAAVQFAFPEPGLYEVELGLLGNREGFTEDEKGCATKQILVLEPERLQEIRDSLGNGGLDPKSPQYRSPDALEMQREIALVDRIKQIRDSIGLDSIKPKEKNTEGLSLDGYDIQIGNPGPNDFQPKPSKSSLLAKETQAKDEASKPKSPPTPASTFNRAVLISVIDEAIDSIYQLRLPARVQGMKLIIPILGTPLWEEGMLDEMIVDDGEGLHDFVVRKNTGSKEPEMILGRDARKIKSLLEKCSNCLPVSKYIQYPGGQLDFELIEFKDIQRIVELGLVVRISEVHFDHDSHKLRAEYHPFLDRLAVILLNNPNLGVEIMGHTDSDGTESYNERLSRKRAYAIAKYFINSGYEFDSFKPKGFGESSPVSSNKTSFGKQLNRRVEFRFFTKE